MFPTNDELFNLMILKGATGGAVVEATATGNPLSFLTDLAKPLKSLLVPFTPQQSGTGDPSPQNPRPLLPWDGLTVFGGGKSLFPFVRTEYEATSNYNGYDTQNTIPDAFIGQKLTYSAYFDNTNSAESSSVKIWGKDKNDSWIWLGSAGNEIGAGAKGTSYKTILIPQNVAWIAFGMIMKAGSKYSQPMVELGETATAYEPYHTITDTDIVFPSAVYGGELEAVSGKLMDAFKSVDLGNKSWSLRGENTSRQVWETFCDDAVFSGTQQAGFSANAYCSEFAITTSNGLWTPGKFAPAKEGARNVFIFVVPAGSYASAAECKTAMAGIQLVYELATPQEIQLTPAQITALVGNNTIWSDADGQMTAVYLKKK